MVWNIWTEYCKGSSVIGDPWFVKLSRRTMGIYVLLLGNKASVYSLLKKMIPLLYHKILYILKVLKHLLSHLIPVVTVKPAGL